MGKRKVTKQQIQAAEKGFQLNRCGVQVESDGHGACRVQ
jgi:hypothetical protein